MIFDAVLEILKGRNTFDNSVYVTESGKGSKVRFDDSLDSVFKRNFHLIIFIFFVTNLFDFI